MFIQNSPIILLLLSTITTRGVNTEDSFISQLQRKINIRDSIYPTMDKTRIKSRGPDIARAKKYVYLTAAAYCFNLEEFDCHYCKTAKALGFQFEGVVNNSNANTFGFLSVNEKDKEIVLTFRGSYNLRNLLFGLEFCKVEDDSSSSLIKVHKGYNEATLTLYPMVVRELNTLLKRHSGYHLVIAGHSLGAAIGSITLYMLQQRINLPDDFPEIESYSYFGYGGPRNGNQAFVDYFNEKNIQISRVVNKRDPIPHIIPANFGYFHFGNELWIMPSRMDKLCSKNFYEDSSCSNSEGPWYIITDHLQYWDVDFKSCGLDNPIDLLMQLIIPPSYL